MVLQTDCIKKFLQSQTYPDLANLYHEDMEVQVIVAQGGGVRTDKDFKGKRFSSFSDGVSEWYPIRINAPEPREMMYDLCDHAEGIGCTGWDFKNKKSIWVGFDFDSLVGHAKGLSENDLREIESRIKSIPYVTLRKSTSSKGLHLYVFIKDSPTTDTHNEHAALAKAILSHLSMECNFNFPAKVDVMGHVLWIWHRKMRGTDGLALIKQGTPLDYIPPNWKDYISVTSGKRLRSNQPLNLDDESKFEQLSGQRSRTKLDKEHYRLLHWLQESKWFCAWDADRHMLITHTCGLRDAYLELKLRGIYETISTGSDPRQQNCFAFPSRNGGWIIRRYNPGTGEATSWTTDLSGFTKCEYNKEPSLETVAKAYGGIEDTKSYYVFNEINNLNKALISLNVSVEIPPKMDGRKSRIKRLNDEKIIVEIEFEQKYDLPKDMPGWLNDKKWWSKVIYLKDIPDDNEIYNIDNNVRHVVSEDDTNLGWYVKTETNWIEEPLQHIKNVLEGPYAYSPKTARKILGSNVLKPWKIVNIPFQPEYPGERIWNRSGARFRYAPSTETSHYPHWSLILSHIGQSIDHSVRDNEWGKKNLIQTGEDYLLCWIASIFQQPYLQLPYLFLYGPENSGKSILHEALSILITKGYTRADDALTSNNNFNAELDGAIIAIVEETDLKKDKTAAARIKDWVTGLTINIHAKGKTPYLIRNATHWIQISNSFDACPIFPGDSRITMIKVNPLEQEIPKHELIRLLQKEAPDFLSKILSVELPPSPSRLNIPVIITDDKIHLQRANRTPVEEFLEECVHYHPGNTILYNEVYERFEKRLDFQEKSWWSIIKFGRLLPPHFPKGRTSLSSSYYLGNISFDKSEPIGPKLVLDKKGFLRPNGQGN